MVPSDPNDEPGHKWITVEGLVLSEGSEYEARQAQGNNPGVTIHEAAVGRAGPR